MRGAEWIVGDIVPERYETRVTYGFDAAARGDPTAVIVTYSGGRDGPTRTVVTRTVSAWAARDRMSLARAGRALASWLIASARRART